MNLLRIFIPFCGDEHPGQAQRCQWVQLNDSLVLAAGEGTLAEIPQGAERIHLVISAAQVLIARARIPRNARSRAGPLLAFAVEEKLAGDPEASQASWLGTDGDEDVLAVVDKHRLDQWKHALDAVGAGVDEVYCETLLLPVHQGEWSIAWNGHEGFVRSGEFEGAATDCGSRESPPLSLRLMLEAAAVRNARPAMIALYSTMPGAEPDLMLWQQELGVELRSAGTWDWRTASTSGCVSLVQQAREWRVLFGAVARLRPAAWILGAVLALHAVALVIDWTLLASEQRRLRQQMEAQFRSSFPDAVAVAAPALQMRRKLAEARHSAGISDSGDFLPMIGLVAAAVKEFPAGTIHVVSYAGGRMTLELATNEKATVQRIAASLLQSGLMVDSPPADTKEQGKPASTPNVLIVRAL